MNSRHLTIACSIISCVSVAILEPRHTMLEAQRIRLEELSHTLTERRGKLAALTTALSSAGKTNRSMDQLVDTHARNHAIPMAARLHRLNKILKQRSSAYLVSITQLSPAAKPALGQARRISELIEHLAAAPQVQRVRLRVRGRHESIEGLTAFLECLRELGAVIAGIDVFADTFDADLVILG